MADLTLTELSGIPEKELKEILKAEVRIILGSASPKPHNHVMAKPTLRYGFSPFAWAKSLLRRPVRHFN